MTPGTRLLNAARAWLASDPGGAPATPETHELEVAVNLCAGVRALYPAAHAIGDRASVVCPPEMREAFATQHCKDFTGTVTGVEFHTDGIDYRVTGDGDPDYTVVDSAFVHPAPQEPGCITGARIGAEAGAASPSWFPMDGRRVSPRVAAQMHDMAVATGRVPAEAPTDVSAIPKRTGAPKNEYVCLLLGGNPLTRCVLASGHEGACVARDPDADPRDGRAAAKEPK